MTYCRLKDLKLVIAVIVFLSILLVFTKTLESQSTDSVTDRYLDQIEIMVTPEWLDENLIHYKGDVEDLEQIFEIFRFQRNLHPDSIAYMKEIWVTELFAKLFVDRTLRITAELVFAEKLAKVDAENYGEYHQFIVEMTKDESFLIRARALLYLGEIATNKDLPIFEEAFSDESAMPAIQAGIGLMTLGTPEAIQLLQDQLQKIANENSFREITIGEVLNESYEYWKSENENRL